MSKFVKLIKNDQGMTLIELIATLTILSLVMGSIYGVITFGFTAYNKVTVENSLRDEADILMSTIMSELYTYGPTSVRNNVNDNGLTLERKGTFVTETVPNKQILIKNGTLFIKNDTDAEGIGAISDLKSHLLAGSKIELDCGRATSCTDGLISIVLVLQQSDQKQQLHQITTESRFGF
ncbi:PulJ/GspJ family protein [Paenibacillus oryzisoli]|uniref:Prepilin-type N-terminal cleavage/methylation domain-containing protein n=1 Tax=Paenibacillus oryzisoli TaxID=1850517 RepID=A0A197ZYP0_9BACL|nr:prepilin-type N-terminal cleavage/methylation domain-containing protein [Paenibacillus oryzisoli]OAS13901.1 hypothetical protein A8708_11000 [Paenibacillus oryzisoli]